ncbi:MAG: hypothetical protein WD058_04490 [Dehalococcoidia bacterium]
MRRYLQPALLPIPIGLLIGVIAAATIIDTDPPALGWFLGVGLGLMGGAFLAAIASGDALVSGPRSEGGRGARGGRGRRRSAAPWLDQPDEGDEGDEAGREPSDGRNGR